MIVVTDDEDRENEGDLTIAAEFATPEAINFMARHGRGLICLSLTPERCDELGLPLMSPVNTSRFSTAFCEAIDAAEGVSTGISAADRARTIQVAIDPRSGPRDLAPRGRLRGAVLRRPLGEGGRRCECRHCKQGRGRETRLQQRPRRGAATGPANHPGRCGRQGHGVPPVSRQQGRHGAISKHCTKKNGRRA